jgi:hypothetical protein
LAAKEQRSRGWNLFWSIDFYFLLDIPYSSCPLQLHTSPWTISLTTPRVSPLSPAAQVSFYIALIRVKYLRNWYSFSFLPSFSPLGFLSFLLSLNVKYLGTEVEFWTGTLIEDRYRHFW